MFQYLPCENCGEYIYYNNTKYGWTGWCKPCQINNLKKNFTDWTSGNQIIDNLIQEMHPKINYHNDVVFEWIPYDQFIDIKEIGKDDFTKMYSAIWKDGPLNCNYGKMEYTRNQSKKVNLKCNLQFNIKEFLNEV